MDSISSLVDQENRLTAWTLQRDAIARHPGSRQDLVARDPHRNLLTKQRFVFDRAAAISDVFYQLRNGYNSAISSATKF